MNKFASILHPAMLALTLLASGFSVSYAGAPAPAGTPAAATNQPAARPANTTPATTPATAPTATSQPAAQPAAARPATTAAAPVAPAVIAPAGFHAEVGKTQSIAVGGSAIYSVSYDGKSVLQYDEYTMNPNPWKPIPFTVAGVTDMSKLAIDSVACGVDDSLFMLDMNGIVYRYNQTTKAFEKLATSAITPAHINSLSVGNAGNIWAIDNNKNVLHYVNNDWQVVEQGVGLDIAVGADGTVVGINIEGEAYFYKAGTGWIVMPDLPNNLDVDQIAVGSHDQIWAVTHDGKVAQFVNNAWVVQPNCAGFANLSVNAVGTVFLLDKQNNVWHNEIKEATVTVVQEVPAAKPGAPAEIVSVPVTAAVLAAAEPAHAAAAPAPAAPAPARSTASAPATAAPARPAAAPRANPVATKKADKIDPKGKKPQVVINVKAKPVNPAKPTRAQAAKAGKINIAQQQAATAKVIPAKKAIAQRSAVVKKSDKSKKGATASATPAAVAKRPAAARSFSKVRPTTAALHKPAAKPTKKGIKPAKK